MNNDKKDYPINFITDIKQKLLYLDLKFDFFEKTCITMDKEYKLKKYFQLKQEYSKLTSC